MSNIFVNRLEGKIAAVTASTDGIGYAIAKRLAQEGAKVIISSRKQQNVDLAISKLGTEGIKVTGIVCHVAKAEDRQKLLDEANKLGGLDILVSNAAVNPSKGTLLDCSESAWDKIFEVNVKAAFLLTKEATPLFRKRGGGRIIYISSISGFHPLHILGAYAVSKTSLFGLTRVAANDLVNENITVNCVAPGLINTKFAEILTQPKVVGECLKLIPMNKIGETSDISGVVAFLASEDANYITGETIVAAGGMLSRL